LLQVAGPSGHGYMSERQLNASMAELQERGNFHNGIYTWYDADGVKHNQDSYEAVREHAFKQPVRYPRPRYETPILFRPERFDYIPALDGAGVAFRHLGTFNERRLMLQMMRLDAGTAMDLGDAGQTLLVYCIHGKGTVGDKAWRASSAFEVRKGTQVRVEAASDSEFYLFGLPVF
jgi:hypothetical protein